MAEVNIDDLVKGLSSSVGQEQDVSSIISGLGTTSPSPTETSLLSEYGQAAKQGLAKVGRGAELLARGMAQSVPTATAGYMAGGPVGGMIGSVAIPFGDTLNSIINRVAGTNLRMPSEIVSTNLAKAGLKPPTTEAGRVAEAAGAGLGGAASELSSMYGLAKSASPVLKQIGEAFTQKAGRQLATAPAATGTGQYVSEETGNPFAGMLASLGVGSTAGLSALKKAKGAPTHEDLVFESKNLYDKAKQSGVQFDTVKFADEMYSIGKGLRSEGYTPKAYPGIASVIEEMSNVQNPKDFTELQSIRKMIQGQQKSSDPETRRLASILKDDFDNYLLSAPTQHITTGTAEGLKHWAEARNSYSRLKKSEIFDDMLQNAELDKSKFTQSGAENSMAQQLRQLSKNDKKMRTFTKEEQDAIREAAKGGSVQNLLKFYGRFAPTGPVSGLFAGGATALEPLIGVPFAAGASGARMGAEAMRRNSVENLGAQMRLGRQPEFTPRIQPEQALIATQPATRNYYLNDLLKEQK